ncbi:MAG: 30S ribosomal protein S13 [Nitrososphaerota archaeon]|nr:30S ribosomal protein S13 [Candidatus Calditenuaceae archaeon]MDW8073234.1 30S ribosomal protein S13 [Nitrososphaerota archaeon]
MSQQELRLIVRLLNVDLDGGKKLPYALAGIKGVGIPFGYAVARALNIDPDIRLGQLTDQQLAAIEDVIKNPGKHGIPSWMYNRRRDPVTGRDLHLTGADLDLAIKEDIQREMRIKSWRGVRHALGLKVRGQRTRTTGRKTGPVGVVRRAAEAAAKEKEASKK